MEEDLNTRILNSYAEALFNESYYRRRAHRLATYDWTLRFVSVLLSTSAAGTALAKLDAAIPIIAAFASAGAGTATLVARFSDNARKFEALAASWTKVVGRLAILDEKPAIADRERLYDEAKAEAEKLQGEDTTPRLDKLAEKVQSAIEKQLGHRYVAEGPTPKQLSTGAV